MRQPTTHADERGRVCTGCLEYLAWGKFSPKNGTSGEPWQTHSAMCRKCRRERHTDTWVEFHEKPAKGASPRSGHKYWWITFEPGFGPQHGRWRYDSEVMEDLKWGYLPPGLELVHPETERVYHVVGCELPHEMVAAGEDDGGMWLSTEGLPGAPQKLVEGPSPMRENGCAGTQRG